MTYLKQRGGRLYKFDPDEMRLFGNAIQNSRLNFWGPGDGIVLEIEDQYGRPGLQYLTGIASSSINPLELGVRQTLTLDIGFSVWLALSSGNQPLIHPVKKVPYGWEEIAGLLSLNPDTAARWGDYDLRLRTFEEVLSLKQKHRKSTVLSKEIDEAAVWNTPPDTNLAIKRRDSRLLKFDLKELARFGLAIRESRNNFFGEGQLLAMRSEYDDIPSVEKLTGLGASVVSKIERKLQNTITLDNVVTLWVAMGSGEMPPIHPLTSELYDWDEIASLLTLDETIAKRWLESDVVDAGIKLKTITEVVNLSVDAKKPSKNRRQHDGNGNSVNRRRNAKLAIV